jgi:hypothetical protein
MVIKLINKEIYVQVNVYDYELMWRLDYVYDIVFSFLR